MTLPVDTQLGPYRIVAPLGAGGMGEVYKARDTRLKRDVAIKVLPEAFAQDPDRLARFQREAELLATLNHPNIAAVYGLEQTDPSPGSGRAALTGIVLELVEGDTLADLIGRGPIALSDALPIARQIADALEAAHEKGVIHRDLKPSNIKITPAGVVKVLDFGLAKAFEPQSVSDLSHTPTMTSPAMTRMGVILGTAAYMSPEQARGKTVDKRTDIWAFGCVLYEMLTGRRAFNGDEISDVLARILEREPDFTALPPATPPAIRRLLRRSLEKDRKRRLPDIAVARLEIDEAQTLEAGGSTGPALRTAGWRRALPWALTSAFGMALVLAWWAPWRHASPAAPEMRLEINTPPTVDPVSLAISPDGQAIVFAATSEGRSGLWLRSLDSVSARQLAGTEGGFFPFWSPDSRSIGFFAAGKLKRIEIDGGLVRALANAPNPFGGAWNRDGTILFTPNATGPIFRTSATDGEPAALTRIEAQQSGHSFPQFLPDGRHFLYSVVSPETGGVYVGQLAGSETRRVLDVSTAVYASSGHLLFVRQGTLFAQHFDPVRLALTGNPFPVAEQVVVSANVVTSAALSASAAGPIAYRAGLAAGGQRQFVWVDRSGKEIGKVGDPDNASGGFPAISPDGRRVALQRVVGNLDVWLLDLGRGVLSRFTFDASADGVPIWSPDGSRIVFNSNRKGVFDLYEKPATGTGSEEPLLATPQNKAPGDWSPDGRFILYRSPDPKTGFDIWALPLDGDRKPFPVVHTNFEERDGQFSPDGKWIAYQSDESGRVEIYVQPFPGPGGKSQISTNGGAQVRWRHDGKELFYIALDDRLMAVPIQLASDGRAVEAGSPVPLFTTRVGGAVQGAGVQQYMVSPDGQRFLMNAVVEEASTSPITVILNWKPKS